MDVSGYRIPIQNKEDDKEAGDFRLLYTECERSFRYSG